MLKIFLSWSGEQSRLCAEELKRFLPFFNSSIEAFVSSADIRKGDRGLQRIAAQLEGSTFGIVCITPHNRDAPWINFESGALSRQVAEGKVIPFLLGASVRDLLESPLEQFQAVVADSGADVLAMIKSINARCEPVNEEKRIEQLFEVLWPETQQRLAEIMSSPASLPDGSVVPQRRTEEILDDLLPLIREQIDRITELEGAVRALRLTAGSLAPQQDRRVPFNGMFDETGPRIPAAPLGDITGTAGIQQRPAE
ncbi:toll/interleukin-1 receptor domain-containing protein [Streptacidiphilus jiangxiensis]|uniref:TIR domain-containing protein n=1 Tax=Streptacidiphilus jiangxiensis TaxID=235985 RepID=A0A1H7I1Y0_STRJI|nr:toll/interleukin-1 receptor domain-containing protein [Streptacidiphilus jiangxiensis]SEK54515.1 TIR domain-containing protein [Streptacidiphilus jiangxiensis]